MAELTLVGMRIVREVAARGSLTGAARALGYTQSAISRQVALMEAAAGAPLFERLPRGVRPTARGRALLAHLHPILDRVDAAALALTQLEETLTDRLTLGAFPTALSTLVPRALKRMQQEHPAISVRLREGGSAAQLRRLRAERVDVAVIAAGASAEYDLEGLTHDALYRGAMMLVVGAQHPFAGRSWVNVGDLYGQTWIVGEATAEGPQFGVWPTLQEDATVAYALRDWPARLGLVAAGLGVAVIPSLLADALPPGLHAINVDDPRPVRREVLAVTRPDRSAATQALVDALAQASRR
ncbi:LysR family transcriptional regulator [Solirubrobacter sp. CPCC 204708]|uniref:LysR family transcriptional regulator n=1 Tax=Solirubrobacter deserti TaxID=2282478 RepID=A0ABT4RTY9_9ACTN|nr:LysR family transcriptional regulator [Solirubrobacter deserti]MBE2317275.1 LysR family transcriptional regulator [Solirubrobacter deserti]MDA0142042.1 LysR family transcriptional regulator [Solirubrobacter deserti]